MTTPKATLPTEEGLCKVTESEIIFNGMAQPKERLVSIYDGKMEKILSPPTKEIGMAISILIMSNSELTLR